MATYRVKEGQTIYDLALVLYGDVSRVWKLLQDNPAITSLQFDFSSTTGMEIVYEPSLKKAPSSRNRGNVGVVNTSGRYRTNIGVINASESGLIIAQEGQSIYDVCLMAYGSLEYLVKLVQDNDIGNLNNRAIAGKVFTFNPQLVKDKTYTKSLKDSGIVLVTGSTPGRSGRAHNESFSISFN